jgi:sarcosine oxidase subunit alpha
MTTPITSLPAGSFLDPLRPLTFTFEGRTIPAFHGQTIAAALYAAGVRIFTRSFKYHRPRGLLCVSGDCPNCLMQVDGRPNVRTCTEPARQGQVVAGQNAWPGLRFDLLRIFDRLAFFLPVGFYYKRFHKPRWLWPVFEHVVRHVAGLGRIDVRAWPESDDEVEHLQADVCVVGAGPAGLAAAAAAAEVGADVVLLEREPQWGGHLLYEGQAGPVVEPLARTLRDRPGNVRVFLEATAFGLYEGNLLGAFQQHRLLKIRAGQIIVCTGARQRPFLFANNDLPGIFLGRGVLRLARLYGIRAGKRAVVMTDNDDGHRLAEQLVALGMEVAAVVDARPPAGSVAGNLTTLPGHVVVRARGTSHLRAVDVGRVNEAGSVNPTSERRIDCDILCLASRLVPANELLRQGGMRFAFHGGVWLPNEHLPGLMAAGAAAGTFELELQLREGRSCGRQAAGQPEHQDWPAPPDRPSFPMSPASPKCFVCLCEDVTTKDLGQAVAEGFDHVETLKRYATVGMGPCQGKVCGQTATEVCARLTGRDIGTVGSTTSRPPVVPVELAVLAAERGHHPVRRTPLHHWHDLAGARWMDAGQWKRPESYGDPEDEVRAVRSGAGLIDVGTLGKIEVIGPDAAELLERIYLNEWANLAVGRARYGVMCTEEGIVFDDGVGARLGPEHFYLTATTGNAEAVFQWLELWRTSWRLNVTVLNQTAAFAAVNLAGPRAREVLARLTSLDLSAAAFPYPSLREAEVAGVPCHLLRVGFVGEAGFEIHCAAAHAWHLWEALLAAGADLGIRPFGVEAQRILRLEKGHLIVGQDTDALSNPFGAGLGRMVRLAKPLFHGREALLRLRERGGGRSRLVGFQLPEGVARKGDNGWARQLEGCQVVEDGRPAGRVTSARHSPTLDRYIGLAWVPEARSAAGQTFLVRCNDADIPALVTPIPFYDPQGERLKS